MPFGMASMMNPTSILAPFYLLTYNGELEMDLDEDDLREYLSGSQSEMGKMSMTEFLQAYSRIGTVDDQEIFTIENGPFSELMDFEGNKVQDLESAIMGLIDYLETNEQPPYKFVRIMLAILS